MSARSKFYPMLLRASLLSALLPLLPVLAPPTTFYIATSRDREDFHQLKQSTFHFMYAIPKYSVDLSHTVVVPSRSVEVELAWQLPELIQATLPSQHYMLTAADLGATELHSEAAEISLGLNHKGGDEFHATTGTITTTQHQQRPPNYRPSTPLDPNTRVLLQWELGNPGELADNELLAHRPYASTQLQAQQQLSLFLNCAQVITVAMVQRYERGADHRLRLLVYHAVVYVDSRRRAIDEGDEHSIGGAVESGLIYWYLWKDEASPFSSLALTSP